MNWLKLIYNDVTRLINTNNITTIDYDHTEVTEKWVVRAVTVNSSQHLTIASFSTEEKAKQYVDVLFNYLRNDKKEIK